MRPKLLTPRNILLLLIAAGIFGALAVWIKNGMPLPGTGVPSTAGKIAFISTRNGAPDLWMMDGADGGNAIALTSDAAEDNSPAWNRAGSELAFVSGNRKGVTSQIFRMDAMPKANILQVTNTTSTKYDPSYGQDDLLFYMDTGKLQSFDAKANDTEAVLPHADSRRDLAVLMERGGFERVRLAPDGSKFLAILKLEEAEALVMYVHDHDHDGEQLILFGVAKKIRYTFKPDGSFVVVYGEGAPLPQPGLLYKDHSAIEPTIMEQLHSMTENSFLVAYDGGGTMQGTPSPIPMAPDYFEAAPNGKYAIFATENEKLPLKGIFRVPIDGDDHTVKPLFKEPGSHPTWSPDSSTIAFVHNGDIYTVSVDGGEPKNLTNGQGKNTEPTWSPAVPKK